VILELLPSSWDAGGTPPAGNSSPEEGGRPAGAEHDDVETTSRLYERARNPASVGTTVRGLRTPEQHREHARGAEEQSRNQVGQHCKRELQSDTDEERPLQSSVHRESAVVEESLEVFLGNESQWAQSSECPEPRACCCAARADRAYFQHEGEQNNRRKQAEGRCCETEIPVTRLRQQVRSLMRARLGKPVRDLVRELRPERRH
jgi:hypothetical protein